jgi:hypothetical protein
MDENIPTYECRKEDNQFIFFCPKCEKTHYHAPEEGHRVAHCKDNNHHPKGYFLKQRKEK